MFGARAVGAEGFDVLGRAIALVRREAVLRVTGVHLDEHPVAFDLGHDRGERDGEALAVAALDRFVRPGERTQRQAVDEHEERARVGPTKEFAFRARGGEEGSHVPDGQLGDAAGHREASGPEDVMRGDLHHRAGGPGGLQLSFGLHLRDGFAELGALLRGQLLGVVRPGEFPQPGRLAVEAGVEQHRRGDHRAAERPAAGLIHARDARTIGTFLAVE